MQRRNNILQVRMNDAERQMAESLCRELGISNCAELIRYALRRMTKEVK
jgi:hypothetical protein